MGCPAVYITYLDGILQKAELYKRAKIKVHLNNF